VVWRDIGRLYQGYEEELRLFQIHRYLEALLDVETVFDAGKGEKLSWHIPLYDDITTNKEAIQNLMKRQKQRVLTLYDILYTLLLFLYLITVP
jgi:hypothetical protein